MGLLGLLKNIFTVKPKQQTQVLEEQAISLSELESWFAEKEAEITRRVENLLLQTRPKLLDAVQKCDDACTSLKTAQPRYTQLYAQNKVVADGNRGAFIILTENFLKSLTLPDSLDQFFTFIKSFDSSIESFIAASNKSFAVSNEFFTEQTTSVRASLQKIDRLMQELKRYYQKQRLAELSATKQSVAALVKKVQRASALQAEHAEIEGKISALQEEKQKVQHAMSEFLQSSAFAEKQKLEAELKATHPQIKAQEQQLHSVFTELHTPLRKLAWNSPDYEKLINRYFSNLIEAVSQDHDFRFGLVLEKLRSAIERGEIYAKDKRRSQALQGINKITREYLQNWLATCNKAKAKEAELKTQIESSDAAAQETELKAQLQRLELESDTLNKRNATAGRAQKRINLDKELAETSNKLSSFLGYTVSISKN